MACKSYSTGPAGDIAARRKRFFALTIHYPLLTLFPSLAIAPRKG